MISDARQPSPAAGETSPAARSYEASLTKLGGHLRILCRSRYARDVVEEALSYEKKVRIQEGGREHVVAETVYCYQKDRLPSGTWVLMTQAGFLHRLVDAFREHRVRCRARNESPPVREGAFEPCWEALSWAEFRPGQREALEKVLTADRGLVIWPTGAGKSFWISCLCLLLPRARILVTTPHIDPLEDLRRNLRERIPGVGLVHGGKNKPGRRVTVCSTGCLWKMLDWKPDLLLADEVHELATPSRLEAVTPFVDSRMIGLSANYWDRSDKADFELEGLFGPVIASKSYEQAVADGDVVPIEVRWRSLSGWHNPASGWDKSWQRERHGIWRHQRRNEQIAEDARSFPDHQVLIAVKTIEHALSLRQLLPEFEVVHAEMDPADRAGWIRAGLLDPADRRMTSARREWLKREFEAGRLRKAISTTVWNRGVNFRQLGVLIRADATASAVPAVQVTGRLSRTTDVWDKEVGVLIDYLDEFDSGFAGRAQQRRRRYAQEGWRQLVGQEQLI